MSDPCPKCSDTGWLPSDGRLGLDPAHALFPGDCRRPDCKTGPDTLRVWTQEDQDAADALPAEDLSMLDDTDDPALVTE